MSPEPIIHLRFSIKETDLLSHSQYFCNPIGLNVDMFVLVDSKFKILKVYKIMLQEKRIRKKELGYTLYIYCIG